MPRDYQNLRKVSNMKDLKKKKKKGQNSLKETEHIRRRKFQQLKKLTSSEREKNIKIRKHDIIKRNIQGILKSSSKLKL